MLALQKQLSRHRLACLAPALARLAWLHTMQPSQLAAANLGLLLHQLRVHSASQFCLTDRHNL